MYEEYEFQEQFMRNLLNDWQRYTEATRNHIKSLEGKTEFLEDRIMALEKQYEMMQLSHEMLKKENEALKAYIKSGEKIIKLEKDFTDDKNGSV